MTHLFSRADKMWSKPMRRLAGIALVLTGLVSVQACGFHLRGSADLPEAMNITHIQDARPPTDVALPLRQALTRNGAEVVESASDAGAVLSLSAERFNRRLLSTTTSSRVKEYELNYAVTFGVKRPGGEVLLAPQTVEVVRQMTFDETQVLAETSEQQQLRQKMVNDAVRQILRRLQRI